MSRRCDPRIFATLAVAFLAIAPASVSAQQSGASGGEPLHHIAADAISAADRAAVATHQGEIGEAARIYGYRFESEKWIEEQTICSLMRETILLHYREIFPDGTESLFVALVPRGAGRVHIVPVLYHNATPFVPAPKNPSNYALFNELVPEDIARKGATPNGDWLQLSVCYAEMTGGDVNISPDRKVNLGVVTAPLPTNHIEIQDRTIRVTFADRESEREYRVWSISFNRNGRVKAAATEDRPVFAAKNMLQSQTPLTSQPPQSTEGLAPAMEQHPLAATTNQLPENPVEPGGDSTSSAPASASTHAGAAPSGAAGALGEVSSKTGDTSSESGWRLVTHPAEPPSKIVPPAPPPPEKITPEPPDPTAQSPSQPQ